MRGLEQTRRWLETIPRDIRKAFDEGCDVSEAVLRPLPVWTASIALAHYEYERTVMHLYAVLGKERMAVDRLSK